MGFVVHALLALGLLAPLWKQLRKRERQIIVGGLALGGIRALVWPLDRHFFTGHERHYFELFRGTLELGIACTG